MQPFTYERAADPAAGARGYGGNDFKIPLAHRTIFRVLADAVRPQGQ